MIRHSAIIILFVGLLIASGCESASPSCCDVERNDLASMTTARMTIGDHEFEVWLALTARERRLGLMHVDAAELAPTGDGAIRGMLFVFADEAERSFWMLNTPTALDIAFLRADGTIVTIHTMQPYDTSGYPSGEPVQYALEVLAGTFEDLGVAEGDRATLPEGL